MTREELRANATGGRGKGGSALAPGPTNATLGGGTSTGRRRPPEAPILGQAVARGSTIGAGDPEGPPIPGDLTSAAGIAALRARRRGMGKSVLTGLTEGTGIAARLTTQRRTLKGTALGGA